MAQSAATEAAAESFTRARGPRVVEIGDAARGVPGDVTVLQAGHQWCNLIGNALKYKLEASRVPEVRVSGRIANGEAVFPW